MLSSTNTTSTDENVASSRSNLKDAVAMLMLALTSSALLVAVGIARCATLDARSLRRRAPGAAGDDGKHTHTSW